MHRVLQSLCERVGFSRAQALRHGESRTIRTEVTVEREETTVHLGGVAGGPLDTCPMCGHKLAGGRRGGGAGRV